jgi:DNA polymerase sigma
MKQLIFEAGLSDPFYGGISSYGITLILVTFLQLQERENQ